MSEPEHCWWPEEVLAPDRWLAVAEQAVAGLERARQRQALPHALLLVGPVGLGRELAATEAAALLTCPEQGSGRCGCASCDRVRRGIHPDVELVQAQGASRQIRIEQIRHLVEAAPGRPFEGRRRVWILDDVEAGQMGAGAANAFLKTLEEPPEHAVFILLAANPAAVLPTIISRCQQLLLPGVVAIAAGLEAGDLPPELAGAALSDRQVEGLLERCRDALSSASDGEVIELLRLSRSVAENPLAFQLISAAALEMGAGAEASDAGQDLIELSARLLVVERQCRTLNLNRQRQLLACLLDWQRG